MELSNWIRETIKSAWKTAKNVTAAIAITAAWSTAVMAQWDNLPSMWGLNTQGSTSLQDNLNRSRERAGQNDINDELHLHNDKIARAKNIACQRHLRETGEECGANNIDEIYAQANELYKDIDIATDSDIETPIAKENIQWDEVAANY